MSQYSLQVVLYEGSGCGYHERGGGHEGELGAVMGYGGTPERVSEGPVQGLYLWGKRT